MIYCHSRTWILGLKLASASILSLLFLMFRWGRVSISLFCFLLFGFHCCLVSDFLLTWVSCLCLVFSYFLRPVLQSRDLSYSGLNSGLTLKVVHFLLVTYTVTLKIRDQQVLNQHPSVFWKKYHHCSGKILDICTVGGSKVSQQRQISLCFRGDRQQQMLDLGHSFIPWFLFFFCWLQILQQCHYFISTHLYLWTLHHHYICM